MEGVIRDLERETPEKLKEYEGIKNSLDELEDSLDRLRSEIIKPNLDAKLKHESG